jgi:predicted transcriptional regulator
MEITIRLPSEHVDRLLQQALQGSPARAILSKAIPPDHGGSGTPLHTIICDSASVEALQQLASRCCTPALTIINQAIEDAQPSDPPPSSRRTPRRR